MNGSRLMVNATVITIGSLLTKPWIRIVGMSRKNDAYNQEIRQVLGLSVDNLSEEKKSSGMMDSDVIGVCNNIRQEATLEM